MKNRKRTLEGLEKEIEHLEARVQLMEREIQEEWNHYRTRFRAILSGAKALTSVKWKGILLVALLLLVLYFFYSFLIRSSVRQTKSVSLPQRLRRWFFQSLLLPLLLSAIKRSVIRLFWRK